MILLKRAGVFLLIVALTVGMGGCAVPIPLSPQYNITISSTIGGTVIVPGEGLFSYPAGTVVTLVAEADRSYEFAVWTTNANTIANVHNATTTITLNRNYCFIIANFVD